MPMCIPTGLCFRKETAGVPGSALCRSSKQTQSSLNGLDASGSKEDGDLTRCGYLLTGKREWRSERLNSSDLQLTPIISGSHCYPALRSKYWSHVPLHLNMWSEISHISQAAEALYQPTPYLLLLSDLHIQRQEANSAPKSVLVPVQWASQQKRLSRGGRVDRGGSREENRNRWHYVHLQPMGMMWTPGSKTEITFQTVVALSMLLVMLCEAFSSAIWPNIQPVKKLWEINWRHRNS